MPGLHADNHLPILNFSRQAHSRGRDLFDLDNLIRLQLKIEDVEIGLHMRSRGGSSQRNHAHVDGKAENNLRGRPREACGELLDCGAAQYRSVRCQQRKALVAHLVLLTKVPNFAIPTGRGVATILYETGRHPGGGR